MGANVFEMDFHVSTNLKPLLWNRGSQTSKTDK